MIAATADTGTTHLNPYLIILILLVQTIIMNQVILVEVLGQGIMAKKRIISIKKTSLLKRKRNSSFRWKRVRLRET
jgi:hypothetical protein